MGLSIIEPEKFDYTPGRGILAVVNGWTVLVGNRALMLESRIDLPGSSVAAPDAGSKVFVVENGRFLGSVVIGDTIRTEAKRAIEAFDHGGFRSSAGLRQRRAGCDGAALGYVRYADKEWVYRQTRCRSFCASRTRADRVNC
jgi:hypothetical protein